MDGHLVGLGILEGEEPDGESLHPVHVEHPDGVHQIRHLGAGTGDQDQVSQGIDPDDAALRRQGLEDVVHLLGADELQGNHLDAVALGKGTVGLSQLGDHVALHGVGNRYHLVGAALVDQGRVVHPQQGLEGRDQVLPAQGPPGLQGRDALDRRV